MRRIKDLRTLREEGGPRQTPPIWSVPGAQESGGEGVSIMPVLSQLLLCTA